MKVTVSFNDVRIVVPCGDGDISVRELTKLASTRYRKAIKNSDNNVNFTIRNGILSVSRLRWCEGGGILDPDDKIRDVCDDRELLEAVFDDTLHVGEDASSMMRGGGLSSSSISSDVASRGSTPSPLPHSSSPTSNGGVFKKPNDMNIPNSNRSSSLVSQMARQFETCQLQQPPFRKSFSINKSNQSNVLSSISNNSNVEILTPSSNRHSSSKDGRVGVGEDVNNITSNSNVKASMTSDYCSTSSSCASSGSPSGGIGQMNSVECSDSNQIFGEKRNLVINSSSASASIREYHDELSDAIDVVIPNEEGPLGIHVVPCESDGRLIIQGIEPGGRIDRDGRLSVNDEIVQINSNSLFDVSFVEAQEVFKNALFTQFLSLKVIKVVTVLEDSSRSSSMTNEMVMTIPASTHPQINLADSVIVNNTRQIGNVIKVSLVKGSDGLGFSITTRDNLVGSSSPIYIKNILPNGAALEEGSLRPGDRILKINEESIEYQTQSEVVNLLRQIPINGCLTIEVSRHHDLNNQNLNNGTSNNEQLVKKGVSNLQQQCNKSSNESAISGMNDENSYDNKISHSSSSSLKSKTSEVDVSKGQGSSSHEILTFDIPVHDSERAGLGVSVKGKTCSSNSSSSSKLTSNCDNMFNPYYEGSTGGPASVSSVVDLGIFVKSVLCGGAAYRDGRLQPNDQLISINGVSLLHKLNPDAMETLRKAMLKEDDPRGGHLSTLSTGIISLAVKRRRRRKSQNTGKNTGDLMESSNACRTNCCLIRGRDNIDSTMMNSKNIGLYGNNGAMVISPPPQPVDVVVLDSPSTRCCDFYEEQNVPPPPPIHTAGPYQHQSPSNLLTDPWSNSSAASSNPFGRNQPGRQSMSEKRRLNHATVTTMDPRTTDTYQRRKKLREGYLLSSTNNQDMNNPHLMKSSSLESLVVINPYNNANSPPMMKNSYTTNEFVINSNDVAMNGHGGYPPTRYARATSVRVGGGGSRKQRGCNNSFRQAVDRSYEDDNENEEEGESIRVNQMMEDCQSSQRREIEVVSNARRNIMASSIQPADTNNNVCDSSRLFGGEYKDASCSTVQVKSSTSNVVKLRPSRNTTDHNQKSSSSTKKENRNSKFLRNFGSIFKSNSEGKKGGEKQITSNLTVENVVKNNINISSENGSIASGSISTNTAEQMATAPSTICSTGTTAEKERVRKKRSDMNGTPCSFYEMNSSNNCDSSSSAFHYGSRHSSTRMQSSDDQQSVLSQHHQPPYSPSDFMLYGGRSSVASYTTGGGTESNNGSVAVMRPGSRVAIVDYPMEASSQNNHHHAPPSHPPQQQYFQKFQNQDNFVYPGTNH